MLNPQARHSHFARIIVSITSTDADAGVNFTIIGHFINTVIHHSAITVFIVIVVIVVAFVIVIVVSASKFIFGIGLY